MKSYIDQATVTNTTTTTTTTITTTQVVVKISCSKQYYLTSL